MKLIRRCDRTLQAAHIANVLRAAGFRCTVRNATLIGGIGEIPFLECSPQVWIDNDLDEAAALLLLADIDSAPDGDPTWDCQCGETIEVQFGACWNCGVSRSAAM